MRAVAAPGCHRPTLSLLPVQPVFTSMRRGRASSRRGIVSFRTPSCSFARTFTLSPDFDTEKIEANLQDGVLKLTIPRREEARPRRIEVKSG